MLGVSLKNISPKGNTTKELDIPVTSTKLLNRVDVIDSHLIHLSLLIYSFHKMAYGKKNDATVTEIINSKNAVFFTASQNTSMWYVEAILAYVGIIAIHNINSVLKYNAIILKNGLMYFPKRLIAI